MATYPGGIFSPTNPTSGEPMSSPDHAAQHTSENNEIVAIETFLGTSGSPNFVKTSASVGGDLSGTILDPVVDALNGMPLGSLSGVAIGQSIVWNGSQFVPGPVSSTTAPGTVQESIGVTLTATSAQVNQPIVQTTADGSAEEMGGGGANPGSWTLQFPSNTHTGNALFWIAWTYGAGSYTSSNFTVPSGWSFLSSWTDGSNFSYAVCAKQNAASVASSTNLTFTWNTGGATYGAAKLIEVSGLGTQTLAVDGSPSATTGSGASVTSLATGGLVGLTGTKDIVFMIGGITAAGGMNVTNATTSNFFTELPVWEGNVYGSGGFSFVSFSNGVTNYLPGSVSFTATNVTVVGAGLIAIKFNYSTSANPLDTVATALGYTTARSFSDTFPVSGPPNPSNWNIGVASGGANGGSWQPGNQVGQWISSNVTVVAGTGMILSAQYPSGNASAVNTYGKFTSAGSLANGLILVRALMPASPAIANGYWPAIWALPGTSVSSDNGEIDFEWGLINPSVLSQYGGNWDDIAVVTYHVNTQNTQYGQKIQNGALVSPPVSDMSLNYHVYGIQYAKGTSVIFSIDGTDIFTYNSNIVNVNIQLIMDLVLADSSTNGWHSQVGGSTPSNAQMIISEVAVYETLA